MISTEDSFIKWLDECGNDNLFICDGVLSQCGSDGIDITDTHLGDVPFEDAEGIDALLEEEGYYEDKTVLQCAVEGGVKYVAPKIHYLEWLKRKMIE